MIIVPEAVFVGFALGFFLGNLTALIKYIINALFHWIKG